MMFMQELHPITRSVIGTIRLEGGELDADVVELVDQVASGELDADAALAAVAERRGLTVQR